MENILHNTRPMAARPRHAGAPAGYTANLPACLSECVKNPTWGFGLCSKSCQYVLMVLAGIPPKEWDKRFSPAVHCRAAKVKESFTRKGLQALARAGILDAVTGPHGGYRFARRPDRVSLLDIIQAIDGRAVFDRCTLGLTSCGDADPCPFHETWKVMKVRILKMLKRRTVKDLMRIHRRNR